MGKENERKKVLFRESFATRDGELALASVPCYPLASTHVVRACIRRDVENVGAHNRSIAKQNLP